MSATGGMASTDDPEKCVTVTVPQLQEMLAQGKSELAASQQRLMHEQKEREKTEALLEQQRHFAQASAAEAAARDAIPPALAGLIAWSPLAWRRAVRKVRPR